MPALLVALLSLPPVAAAAPRPAPEPVAAGTVAEIVDGDTLVLEGGVQVRLVGIQAPKLALGRPGFTAWPLAEEAKAELVRLTAGKLLALAYTGQKIDRHGRLLAHLSDQRGTWIQGAMLQAGMARVYTFADNRGRAGDMLAIEDAARRARRGIWGHPYYRLRQATETPQSVGSFQIVEARVVEATRVGGNLYLNFGADWKSDFTVFVARGQLRAFAAAGPANDVAELYRGQLVRVRGWIGRRNGPMIEATHPEQIEVLSP